MFSKCGRWCGLQIVVATIEKKNAIKADLFFYCLYMGKFRWRLMLLIMSVYIYVAIAEMYLLVNFITKLCCPWEIMMTCMKLIRLLNNKYITQVIVIEMMYYSI